MKRDPKTGQIVKSYTEEQFNLLVNTIRFGKPEDVYNYLDKLVDDKRTKWGLFDKAMEKARKLTIDNG